MTLYSKNRPQVVASLAKKLKPYLVKGAAYGGFGFLLYNSDSIFSWLESWKRKETVSLVD